MSSKVEQFENLAKEIIFRAKREDTLAQVTIKSVRREIERKLGLKEGECDAYKDEIKRAVNWALENDEPSPPQTPKPASKGKQAVKGEEESPVKVEEEEKPARKRKSSPDLDEDHSRAKKAKKSRADVSDEEGDEKESSEDRPRKKSPVRARAETPKSPAATSKPHKSPPKPKRPSPKPVKKEDDGHESDTSLSSVYDEPPTARRKKRGSGSKVDGEKDREKPKRGRREKGKSGEPLDPVEEEVARLKKLVNACGVRKIWSKEHAGLTPSQQVRQLKVLLADLGLTGRLTLEKAKKVREKRELQQEIQDVLEFEKARGIAAEERRTRSTTVKKRVSPESADESDGPEQQDDEVVARQKREQDLLAFIGDQSDDD